jgi:hypothetical protein
LRPINLARIKSEKKNPKKMILRTRTISLHTAGRYSFGRNFLFSRMVRIAERAIVKLAILALTAKMIRGSAIFTNMEPQMINTINNR